MRDSGIPRARDQPGSGNRNRGSMTRTIVHRGPDDGGIWVEDGGRVALGNRRLAIVDLSPEGHQPMESPDGRFLITYNGEVYNFEELREELERLGVGLRGHSDTEVILAAITRWGLEASLNKFVGMFALALWDRREMRLHLTRDRIGKNRCTTAGTATPWYSAPS